MWNENRLQELLTDQVEENIHLEYKTAEGLGKSEGVKSEISKDVSAFANSDGSTLIYGIRENGEHRPGSFDPVDLEIPKAQTTHQAADKRYYRRYNFQSIATDDWEIKDIINRQNRTIAQIRFRPRFRQAFRDNHICYGKSLTMTSKCCR